ncbi:MAG TPA: class I SAM-dependent methyltransferase [Candidatus Aquilonibacter sp.]|jgi:ubiquinone/menaquinone biosynthesis C-methylase UbiE|nr:class I SAM-dependent methyltransferase [Candidatus Aquilonibacter sp.]
MVDQNSASNPDPNILTYSSPEVAQYYASLNYLTACERLLFEQHLQPGMAILDLGVGGGRTTPYLSSIAERYVGIDYSAPMIAACREKFPQLEFEVGSAADLSKIPSSSFDAVVMAFNAIDYVVPAQSRTRALQEIHRVLKPSGLFIFSSHNPRSVLARVSWNPKRVRDMAESVVGQDSALFQPLLAGLTGLRAIVACLQAFGKSLKRAFDKLPTLSFWRGSGYRMDAAHGGLMTYFSIPQQTVRELEENSFQSMRILGDDYPRTSHIYSTDWYYYVFSRTEITGEK